MPVYLVCEGPRGGLDDRVLDSLVIQHHALVVQIEPAGGRQGHGAVRTYLESRPSPPNHVAITVEDRDYRSRKTADDTWANQNAKGFIWRRHEIENYLLQPPVVLELFKDFRKAGSAWANSLPDTETDVSGLLQTLARPFLEDHTAELVKGEMVRLINVTGSLSFGPKRPILPGAHTCGQAQWVQALEQEAARLCQTCSAVAALPGLQPGAVTALYGFHLAQCKDPVF